VEINRGHLFNAFLPHGLDIVISIKPDQPGKAHMRIDAADKTRQWSGWFDSVQEAWKAALCRIKSEWGLVLVEQNAKEM
jgi:hypothetical protein